VTAVNGPERFGVVGAAGVQLLDHAQVFPVIARRYRAGSRLGFQNVCATPRGPSTADPAGASNSRSPMRKRSVPSRTYQASSSSWWR